MLKSGTRRDGVWLRLGGTSQGRAFYPLPAETVARLTIWLACWPNSRSAAGGTLSGGEQQLFAVARGLSVGSPGCCGTSGPRASSSRSWREARISRLRGRLGLAVLLVEQNLDFIRGMTDRAVMIERGGTVNEIPRVARDDPALVVEFVGVA